MIAWLQPAGAIPPYKLYQIPLLNTRWRLVQVQFIPHKCRQVILTVPAWLSAITQPQLIMAKSTLFLPALIYLLTQIHPCILIIISCLLNCLLLIFRMAYFLQRRMMAINGIQSSATKDLWLLNRLVSTTVFGIVCRKENLSLSMLIKTKISK